MTMLRRWGIGLPSHDQELFSQYEPKNGQQQCELLRRLDVVDERAVSRPNVEYCVCWPHPTLEIISREDLPNFVALRLGPCEPPGINRLRAMAHCWSAKGVKSYRLQSVLQPRE